MAIQFGDILKHNNLLYPIVDINDVKGGLRSISTFSSPALISEYSSIPEKYKTGYSLLLETSTNTIYYLSGISATNSSHWTPIGIGGAGIGVTNSIPKWTSSSVLGNSNITDNGDTIFINGNLMVIGTTSTISTENLLIKDPIILLAGSQSGDPTYDAGLFVNRGSSDTQAFIWDESMQEFKFITTTSGATVSGNVIIGTYSNVRTGVLRVGTQSVNSDDRFVVSSSGGTVSLIINESSNVGIGTASPSTKLHVYGASGSFKLEDGTQGAGRILTSDSDGVSSWKKLRSNFLNIVQNNHEINLDNVDFTGIKSFYVNSNYVETELFPSDGSLTRPYVNFDSAKTAFMGTKSVESPEYAGATIVIQTNINTSVNPTINKCTIKFENNSTLTYTGTSSYMFDTEILYELVDKSLTRNNLLDDIYMNITGQGTLTRTAGIGLIRGWGSNRGGAGMVNDKNCQIIIAPNLTDVINLKERISYTGLSFSNITKADNTTTLESIYGIPFTYTTGLTASVPLVQLKYQGIPFGWGIYFGIGTINIETIANTGIQSIGCKIVGGKIFFKTYPQLISVLNGQKTSEFTDVYIPKPGTKFIETSANINLDVIGMDDPSGFGHSGVDSFFVLKENANIERGRISIESNGYAHKLINILDSTNSGITTFNFTAGSEGAYIINFKGKYLLAIDRTSFNLEMQNSFIRPFNKKSISSTASENITEITVITNGTLSSFMNVPVISGINDFNNDLEAKNNGLVLNSIYNNTLSGLTTRRT